MGDDPPECACVVDCSGLHEIASLKSDNLKSLFLDQQKKGIISCVWQEFRDLYDDEASALELYVTIKINMKKAYYLGAARIADKLNSGFSRGAYDRLTDLYTASIAWNEEYQLLTSTSQLKYYEGMDCKVSDLVAWAEDLGTAGKKKTG
jgi:hypothetical protein